MKLICHVRSNNPIAISSWNPDHQALMTGAGGWYPLETNIEREIAKKLIENTNASNVEFTADWEAFLNARKGSAKEVKARAYVEAMANGGLSEDEAIAIFTTLSCDYLGDCTNHVIIEDTDLPSDRYFRDAWEWED